MWEVLKGLGLRRRWLAYKAAGNPMAPLYATPRPSPWTPLEDVEFVALDLETTGLSPGKHEIVSIGWIVIRNMNLVYAERGHWLVCPEQDVTGESAVIHTLTDDQLAEAPPLCDALENLFPVLAGRVLIAHHVKVERSFLKRACKTCFELPFQVPAVDTLELEKRTLLRRGDHIKPGALRLDAVRARYNLPRYKSHNALMDAIAAGELFLAQAAERAGRKGKLKLRDVSR